MRTQSNMFRSSAAHYPRTWHVQTEKEAAEQADPLCTNVSQRQPQPQPKPDEVDELGPVLWGP